MREDELMLTELLQCRRIDLYADKKLLTAAQQEEFERMKARRENHEPLQYIVGVCEFMGLDFYVDTRVLVPRPETELLAEAVLKYAYAEDKPLDILDVGTGSGNIIVSLAKKIEDSRFTAIDISGDALEVAASNAEHHGVLDRIQFVQMDFLNESQDLLKTGEKFDIIVSNPPYIATSMIGVLPLDVQQEPACALDGGQDGLIFYRAIAQKAKKFLKPRARIFLEFGDGQQKAIEEIFENEKCFAQKDCLKDYTQTPRILILELN